MRIPKGTSTTETKGGGVMETKAKIKLVTEIICIIVIAWFVASTLEVQLHNLDKGYEYSHVNLWAIITTHTIEMEIVDCEIDKPTDTFLVTVEDSNGNQYAYYDTEYWYPTCKLLVTMQGNRVIDAKQRR